jgi:hypothetical protein
VDRADVPDSLEFEECVYEMSRNVNHRHHYHQADIIGIEADKDLRSSIDQSLLGRKDRQAPEDLLVMILPLPPGIGYISKGSSFLTPTLTYPEFLRIDGRGKQIDDRSSPA